MSRLEDDKKDVSIAPRPRIVTPESPTVEKGKISFKDLNNSLKDFEDLGDSLKPEELEEILLKKMILYTDEVNNYLKR